MSLLLTKEYAFKNVNKTFTLKTPMPYNSFNIIYVVICSGCLEEYIGETAVGKTKLRDRVGVYGQHIKQPEHQKLKVEEHIYVSYTNLWKGLLVESSSDEIK